MPRVSVVIPSYNHEKYVAEAIQSVLNQSYQDFEIIITDDGSADNTVREIKKFTDPRIKLFEFAENQGACIAVNNCIKNSSGEFIALLNSDDVFMLDKLEKQIEFLEKNSNIGAVFSYAKIIDDDSNNFEGDHFYKKIFIQPNRDQFEWLNYFFNHGNCLCHPSILIRKECYEKVGLYDPRFAQLPDFDFWIRLCQYYEIYIIPEKLVEFRVRDNEANASAPRGDSITRHIIEYRYVLNNYLNNNILYNIVQIFPELIESYDVGSQNLSNAKFYLANLAIQRSASYYQLFGFDILYELMSDNQTNKRLKEEYKFTFKDLIKLSGEQNIDQFQELQDIIAGMERSIFWKLRNIWFKCKKLLVWK